MTEQPRIRQVRSITGIPTSSCVTPRYQAISLPCEPWSEPVRVEISRCNFPGCNRPTASDKGSLNKRCPEHVTSRS